MRSRRWLDALDDAASKMRGMMRRASGYICRAQPRGAMDHRRRCWSPGCPRPRAPRFILPFCSSTDFCFSTFCSSTCSGSGTAGSGTTSTQLSENDCQAGGECVRVQVHRYRSPRRYTMMREQSGDAVQWKARPYLGPHDELRGREGEAARRNHRSLIPGPCGDNL